MRYKPNITKMADSGNTTVFSRRADADEDIWDDSALIEAYDRAVGIMQVRLEERNSSGAGPNDSDTASKTKNKKKKQQKKKKTTKKNFKNWSVGDDCRAVFTEDGLVYEAGIMSIDSETSTCVVRYDGYGNEEEQNLSDLLPPAGKHRNNRVYESEGVESDAAMEWHPGHSPRTPTSRHGNPKNRPSPSPSHAHNHHHNHPPHFHQSAVPPFAGFPSFMMPFPPCPPSMSPWMTPPHMSCTPPRIPSMPPPPAPRHEDLVEGDNEALSAMLISWYMSGYHTGYYQGLKQGRKQNPQVSSTTQDNNTKEPEPS